MSDELHSLQTQLQVLKAQVAELLAQNQQKDELIRKLQHQLSQSLRRQYGQKADRIDPNQLLLDVLKDLKAGQETEWPKEPQADSKQAGQTPPKKRGHGRRRIPEGMEQRTVVHDLDPKDKVCPCCGRDKKCIGQERAVQFHFVPAKIVAEIHIQKKYACVCPESTVTTADKPSSPIEKGLAAQSLLSHLIVSKYLDCLPLHRQEGILARYGIEYRRSTMWGQIAAAGRLMEPLYQAAQTEVLASRILGTDDTPVKVIDPDRSRARIGSVWTYVGDEQHPLIVYDFTPGRSREGPETFLANYSGWMQADAMPVYDPLYKRTDNIIWEIGCWSHARRRFVDAQETSPELAVTAVAHIKVLYDIEKDAGKKGLRGEALVHWRKEQAAPVLTAFGKWLKAHQLLVLPQSPIGKAIAYTLSNWVALGRYIEDGDFVPDNNRSERALRLIAVGRGNWLFFGSDHGGHVAAIMLTLLKSAQRNGLNPFDYLADVLARIADHPRSRVADLLPHRWKPLSTAPSVTAAAA